MPKKILIVEDNEKNRLLVRDLMQYYGYEVIEAKNGAEGVELAKGQRPDLVLMDVQMPVMDGITAGRQIRQSPETSGIKIVALTSFAMKGDQERIMASGFDAYVSKPIDTRRLPEIVKQLLGQA